MSFMRLAIRLRSAIAWLLAGGAMVWFGYLQYQDYLKKSERRANEERELGELIDRVVSMSGIHGARLNWTSELMGDDKVRIAPLTSLEVQEVWQRDSPLTFVGVLRDMAKNSDGSYQVLLQHDQLSSPHHFLSTELYYSARCSFEVVAPLIALVRDKDRVPLFADAVVVGQVLSVSSAQAQSSEETDETRITGSGTCLAAMRLEKHLPSNWATRP